MAEDAPYDELDVAGEEDGGRFDRRSDFDDGGNNGTETASQDVPTGDNRDAVARETRTESSDFHGNLYVGNLDHKLTSPELEDAFKPFGPLESALVQTDPKTNESRGFGFVNYVNGEDARKAIEALDNTVLSGRTITVQPAKRTKPRSPTPGKYLGRRNGREVNFPPRCRSPPPPRRDADRGRDRYPAREERPRYRDEAAPPPPRDYDYYDRRAAYDAPPPARDYDRYAPPPRDDYYRRDYYDYAPPPRDAYYDRGGYDYDRRAPPPPARRDPYDRYPDTRGPPPPAAGYRDRGAPPPRDDRYRAPPRDPLPPRRDEPRRDPGGRRADRGPPPPPRDDRGPPPPPRDDRRAPPRDDRYREPAGAPPAREYREPAGNPRRRR
eukprot:TRINITY_DN12252_c3_g2_i3.p2 TRINITY_DN12252_c3_g2~~TRINITY_DN12252_c3_g2_i3.p2  ORF type:complete len:381 (+),score=33.76 TRINITY_DN12252_c3_g2_i3:3517-4659(+)